ncbi:MAG: LysR family transcriptional regulator [Bacteroidales bacterium]|jgi:molybdate transport system regulatory protein|nr:LysR family transcriptional regulator [Bacteroidales bacterium]
MPQHQPFKLKASLEVEKNGICFLSSKRIELLNRIHSSGSILAASKEMRMSYQQAWTIVKDLNTQGSLPVVLRQRGGANGGGTVVTKYGQQLLRIYAEMHMLHQEYLATLANEKLNCGF